jgi:hypothetical protein
VLESPESLSSSFKGLSPPTSDIEPLIEPLNLTSDTDSDSKSESLPEQSEGEFDEVGEVKEEPAHTPSNSKPSLPSSTPPPEFRAVPPPQSKPWIAERSELAAALARFDAAHETRQQHVRANGGGHLTVGSSDAMRWRQ